ncbi:hypothetical protein, partial [Actinomadura roseirufa]|uniref:hypothetical protein n=1 Tax=Actinomadura roseirufa TaxID=2094049 RepID=UPI001A95545A
ADLAGRVRDTGGGDRDGGDRDGGDRDGGAGRDDDRELAAASDDELFDLLDTELSGLEPGDRDVPSERGR